MGGPGFIDQNNRRLPVLTQGRGIHAKQEHNGCGRKDNYRTLLYHPGTAHGYGWNRNNILNKFSIFSCLFQGTSANKKRREMLFIHERILAPADSH
jgi:hypothetical protein